MSLAQYQWASERSSLGTGHTAQPDTTMHVEHDRASAILWKASQAQGPGLRA